MSNPPQPFFPLEPGYLVGVEPLDRQHQEMVNLLNELHGSVLNKTGGNRPLDLLNQLLKLAKTHFTTEEQVLRVHSYPGYLRHKAAHEGLASNLAEYREQIVARKRDVSLEYVELIKLWLLDHFAEFDRDYAKFLVGQNQANEEESHDGRDI
jgi:hemerythrin-like metal-binding protein